MQLIKRSKEYCLFLKSIEEDLEKEIIVFSDKFVELKMLKIKEVYYYKLKHKLPCKEHYSEYSVLFVFNNKCQKDGIVFNDTVHLIALTRNKFNGKTVYAFGQSESEVEQ